MPSPWLFVLGCPRSGTSMLHWMLARHPALAYPDEALARMIDTRWIRWADRLGLPVLRSERLYRRYLSGIEDREYEPGLRFLELEPRIPQEGDSALWWDLIQRAGSTYEEFQFSDAQQDSSLHESLRRRYGHIVERDGAAGFVDKAPRFTVWTDALLGAFPEAQVLHIVRDGRAVVNSIAFRFKHGKGDEDPWEEQGRTWWGPKPANHEELAALDPVARAAHQWTDLVSRTRDLSGKLGDRYREIRYENLVADPAGELQAIFEWAGLPRFGEDLYPDEMENRNYKATAGKGAEFDDPIWTDNAALGREDEKKLAPMRPLLEELGYVGTGAEILRG